MQRGVEIVLNHRDVQQLQQRREALAWWRAQERRYGQLIPFSVIPRILGISRTRLYQLVENGDLRIVTGMPGGLKTDRFVPLDDLYLAPFAAERGRPGAWGPNARRAGSSREKIKKAITY